MSKRLQVLLPEDLFRDLRRAARSRGASVGAWVRRLIAEAVRRDPLLDPARKLAAIRHAARHDGPTADVETMLGEIERGYLGRGAE
jgi:hypothetical protein